MKELQIDDQSLAIQDIVAVALGDVEVAYSGETMEKVRESGKTLDNSLKTKKLWANNWCENMSLHVLMPLNERFVGSWC